MDKILIFGARGQLGKEVNQLFKENNKIEIVNSYNYKDEYIEASNLDGLLEAVKEIKPSIIINCAAYTDVEACESDYEKAFALNALAPKNLSIVSNEVKAKLIHISTDYVFDGKSSKPYLETDKTNPLNVYGKTKLEGEIFVEDIAEKHFIIRTAWLYGQGKNFVKTMLKLAKERDQLQVVDDQRGTPTSAKELAKAISYLMKTDYYGLYHGTCEGEATWADFAELIFKEEGLATKVERVTSDKYKTVAKRPSYSVLENERFKKLTSFSFKDWQDAFKDYRREMK